MMWMLVNRKEDIFEINVRENRRGYNPERQAAKTKKIYKKRNTEN
jgi:hypothetical protein